MNKLSVLIPSYNEEENLEITVSLVQKQIDNLVSLNLISKDSFVAIIDDGSTDNSWNKIEQIKKKFNNLKAIKFSKNQGHQIALYAGIKEFSNKSDFSISIDADGQHDVSKFRELIENYHSGHDIVIAVSDRNKDKYFKKITANMFYKFINLISSNKIEPNHADYRLISKKVMKEIIKHENKHIFLRGIISSLNFKSKTITYKLKKRQLGKSKYSLLKMTQLAIDGITAHSLFPLRVMTFLGFLILFICILLSLSIFYGYFINRNTVPGWASTVLPIYFLGGIQIFFLGIIGEYIAKIYREVIKQPTYSIVEYLD